MSLLLCLGALVLLLNTVPGGSMRHGIIGGNVSVPHSHPFMVYIVDLNKGETCDGFLVSEHYVITAAHCNGFPYSLVAFLGIHDTSKIHIKYSVSVRAIPHPKYNNKTYENDIMLLKLCKPAVFSDTVKPVALPTCKNEKIPKKCTVMGWGSIDFNGRNSSKVLKEVNVTLSKANDCTAPDMICTEGKTGPGKGDSGGPLVCGNVAHGIVSSNYAFNNEIVSRYVRITYHLPWIKSTMNKPPKGRGCADLHSKC
uniref:trypsin n=1 Tax=Astyanax mexicanus TaxID=7994 RepID=A0A8B9L0K6_ASTMX